MRGNPARVTAARAVALEMGGYKSTGKCATGVSCAIQRVHGIKVWGNGNTIDDNLPRNTFKQANIPLSEALRVPGLIPTWEETPTKFGKLCGHTVIALGDGRTWASDDIAPPSVRPRSSPHASVSKSSCPSPDTWRSHQRGAAAPCVGGVNFAYVFSTIAS